MSVVLVSKIETTKVAGGAAPVYGFTISVHSETGEFNFLKSINLDTATLSGGDAAKVTAFIDLVNAQLLL